jgi:carboxysome peptide B
MEIAQVIGTLVCTQRIPGLDHHALRVVRDAKGKKSVATDPVGARPGNWVFMVSGSAGRWAMGDYKVLTDLAIGGIIDAWDDGERAAAPTSGPATQPAATDAAAAKAA